jgi:hypothetical protein
VVFVNTPTVAELLHDCSREVRSIMWDITTLNGPELAAAWPAFAAAAGNALAAVPCPDPAARLLAARMAGPRPRPNRWGPPVDADPDPHLLAASAGLAAVAGLLARHATPPTSAGAAHDGDLARRRIVEALVIGAHATSLGLFEHASRLSPARAGITSQQLGPRRAVAGATLAQSRRLASELDTLQAHGAHYLAEAGVAEPRRGAQSFVDPDRLPHVLAAWEVTTMRVVHASPPSVRDLAGVAHAEQALLVHTMVILNAAAQAAVIDIEGFTGQIRPRLADAHLAWGDVAASWPVQMTTSAPPALITVEASAELHRALGEITREGNGWATAALIDERVHLREVSAQLRDALGSGSVRAERFAELPYELARAGQLRAPARLLGAMHGPSDRTVSQLEGGPRTTDVANRRIVTVLPEQTAGATKTARRLQAAMTSLAQALETLRLADSGRSVPEPALSPQAAARQVRLDHRQQSAPLSRHLSVGR